MIRTIKLLCCTLFCLAALGCRNANVARVEQPVPVEYEAIASTYNLRIIALQTVWARGVVSISFINEKGDRQTEQGNCYLHVIRPDNISFIINKLEQQFVRLGCNERYYWAMDLQEKTARIGDHTNGEAVIDQFGLPISPAELLTVFALAPLPEPGAGVIADWCDDQRHIAVSYPSVIGRTVFLIEPVTYLPVRAELYDHAEELLVRAEFSNPGRTPVPGQGAYSRQIPGQIDIHDLANDSKIKVTFGDTSARRDVDPDNFDLEYLLDVLGPLKIIE